MLRRSSLLRLLMASSSLFNLFQGTGLALVGLFVIQDLRLTPGLYGAAVTAGALGGIVAGPVTPWLSRAVGVRGALLVGIALSSLCYPLLCLGVPGRSWDGALLAAAQFTQTFGLAVFVSTNASLTQSVVEQSALSSLQAVSRMIGRSLLAVGMASAGLLAAAATLRGAVVVVGTCQIVGAAALFLRRRTLPIRLAPSATALPVG